MYLNNLNGYLENEKLDDRFGVVCITNKKDSFGDFVFFSPNLPCSCAGTGFKTQML